MAPWQWTQQLRKKRGLAKKKKRFKKPLKSMVWYRTNHKK